MILPHNFPKAQWHGIQVVAFGFFSNFLRDKITIKLHLPLDIWYYLLSLQGLLEEFAKAIKENGLQNNPRIKLIMSIGVLVADAACDFDLDGT